MESHTNYEDFDEMENPEEFTESQGIPTEDQQVNGIELLIEGNFGFFTEKLNCFFSCS